MPPTNRSHGNLVPSFTAVSQQALSVRERQWQERERARRAELADWETTGSFVSCQCQRNERHSRVYEIHDNGDRPFQVRIDHRDVVVWGRRRLGGAYGRRLLTCRHFGYWGGFDSTPTLAHGNTLLIRLSSGENATQPNRYLCIMNHLFVFDTPADEPILDYVSPIGGNDVPYPAALTRSRLYLLAEHTWVPRRATSWNIARAEEMYWTQYYDVAERERWQTEGPMQIQAIVPRQISGVDHEVLHDALEPNGIS